ncbi:erythromycin esterase-like protein [Aquimarina sp. EL_43]|uniref:erythromycin esterase family protein n=1 Tax=unclassified Aquimarina TaxID=2627091 RepID=UPI0018C90BB9|nr:MULTISPECIES: erythromycin esterase family protein [unclassified Aquimarina]MBG6132597.1 erythromycin esterase-like protein [Aquimarina sp. EL_35]MBG6152728.1 erythromycin esterase-like protein [Aquimarina sp. EL_32]MBG6170735.1 erythromycin esterase-like protein [Aquimarina sp. EL_43]
MRLTVRVFITSILYISCNSQCNSELANYAFGFDNILASSFSFLDKELKDVRIVGYGEDTHGTAEFTILAQEMIKYLSGKHNFKILILETGFGEGAYLNDYIHKKRDDLKTILKDHNSTWRYKTKEFYQLMNWLREYNQNHTDKIHIYGCEMQYVISDVNRIKDYLKLVGFDYVIDEFEKHLWQDIEESEKSDYYISYSKLKNYFIENHKIFKNKTSKQEFSLIYHHVEVLGQFVTVINQNIEQRKHDFRDIYMAENIEWILKYHGEDSKALYWAHNAHVGDWVGNGGVDVTGHQLRKIYDSSYFNIATDFGVGDFIAYPNNANEVGWDFQTFSFDKTQENTFTNCLKKYGTPNTFLNLRKAKYNDDLKLYLEKPLIVMSGAGAQYRNNETEIGYYGKAFDGIIYIDRTHKINWIEQNKSNK